jgi:catecholate siderophore receptor
MKSGWLSNRWNTNIALGAAALMGSALLHADEYPAATTPLSEVVVTGERGYRRENVSSHKYTQPLIDTPQSVTVIPQQLIADQGGTTFRDALRNAPGISLAAGEGGAQGDNLTIRGFSARSDIFMDGFRDFGSYYRDPFNQEQIEVLQGPASVNFGRGSTGGVVNQVSKSAQLDPFVGGTLAVGTDKTQRATFDVNQPLPEWGEHTAFRLNGMTHDSMVAGRDIGENRRSGFAPSLAFGVGTPTRLTLNYFHQSEDDIPDYGIPFLLNKPAPVNDGNYYGFKDGNYLRTDANVGTVKFEHDFSDWFTVRNQVRDAVYDRAARITEPQVTAAANPGLSVNSPVDTLNVTRNEITTDSTETYLGDQLDVTGKFKTGFIHHTVVSGLEIAQETSNPQRTKYTGVPTANLENPDDGQAFSGTGDISSKVDTTANSVAAYVLDTMKLGRLWELSGGVRWDRFDSHYKQTLPATLEFARTDKMVSWRGGLVFKPVSIGSVYFSYGTSFNPSAESLALAANTAEVEPEKSRVYELGTKWDLMQKRVSLSGAVFRDEKFNARTPDPTNSALNILDGDQRVDGFQLGASGRLTERWEIFTGYAYLDSEVRKSGRPLEVEQRVANAPMHTANLWTSYAFRRGLQIGGGANLVTERYANTSTPDPITGQFKTVPGYVVYNAMAKYPLGPRLALQLNVYNLTNKDYIDTLHPNHLIPGAGRSALLTTSFTF